MLRKDINIKIPKPFGKQKSCDECMYHQGLIKTIICPCPQCGIGIRKGTRGNQELGKSRDMEYKEENFSKAKNGEM